MLQKCFSQMKGHSTLEDYIDSQIVKRSKPKYKYTQFQTDKLSCKTNVSPTKKHMVLPE